MSEWNTGRPPEKHGYYLGAWKNAYGKYVVSELWFNEDSIGSRWWAGRGYFRQDSGHQPIDVVAWMPIPEYSDD